jgi:1-acyl-sn-glycerol-3-phosphate acyltransferase
MKKLAKAFFGFWFRLFGWKIEGKLPETKKYLIVVAPHTSNWDFAVGYCVKHIMDLHPDFLAKNSLFKIPLVGWFLRSMGGHPVDRSKNTNMVDAIVEKYATSEKFIMTITPEGTRSYSPNWKTGFYRVAEKANIPIVKAGFDYGKRTVYFDEPRYVTGNMEAEIEEMKAWYRTKKGKHPEKGVV